MKITKTFREKIKRFANLFYKANHDKLIKNPAYECCKNQDDGDTWKCNTCECKGLCAEGEMISIHNSNVISELVDEILDIVKKKGDGK